MIKKESQCCGCEHCINCNRKEILVTYCDKCHYDYETMFRTSDNKDYCYNCLKEEMLKEEYIDEIYDELFDKIIDMYEIKVIEDN